MPKKDYNKQQQIYRPRNSSRSKRRKADDKKWLTMVILVLAFCIAAIAGAIFATSGLFDSKTETPKTETKAEIMPTGDKTIVMLMGVDEREVEEDVGRSDTLMIATLDPKKKKAALLSVPRDTRVKIPGYGFDKINSAYAYGGHQLTQRTVENLLGVKMDHYIKLNVHAFTKIIDAIGGVDINVEKRMYYEDPWDDDGGLVIDLYPGEQHMDGATAITYVRYRDEEGDIGRITRQQKFMQAVMDKVTSPAIIPKVPAIITEVVGSIETDLSVKEMLQFIAALKEAQANGLQTEMLPGKPLYIDEISYWVPDVSKLRTTVANTLDVKPSASMVSAWEAESGEYERSVPDEATEEPSSGRRYHSSFDDDDMPRHRNNTSSSRERERETRLDEDLETRLPNDEAERLGRDDYEDSSEAAESATDAEGPAEEPGIGAGGKTAN